jgi:hypothetical protein
MKIIAKTNSTYFIEATPEDVTAICGLSARNTYDRGLGMSIGTIIHPQECFAHIRTVTTNLEQRQRIAEQLRAAAAVIETTPSPLTIPENNEPTP